jgi:hypothetical protein
VKNSSTLQAMVVCYKKLLLEFDNGIHDSGGLHSVEVLAPLVLPLLVASYASAGVLVHTRATNN